MAVTSLELKGRVGGVKLNHVWSETELSLITSECYPSVFAMNMSAGMSAVSRKESVSTLYFSLNSASFTVIPLLSKIRLSK